MMTRSNRILYVDFQFSVSIFSWLIVSTFPGVLSLHCLIVILLHALTYPQPPTIVHKRALNHTVAVSSCLVRAGLSPQLIHDLPCIQWHTSTWLTTPVTDSSIHWINILTFQVTGMTYWQSKSLTWPIDSSSNFNDLLTSQRLDVLKVPVLDLTDWHPKSLTLPTGPSHVFIYHNWSIMCLSKLHESLSLHGWPSIPSLGA